MPKVRVNAFSISLDGYGAGPDQGLDNPLGRGGESLLGGLDLPRLGYDVAEHVPTESATHIVFSKRSGGSQ